MSEVVTLIFCTPRNNWNINWTVKLRLLTVWMKLLLPCSGWKSPYPEYGGSYLHFEVGKPHSRWEIHQPEDFGLCFFFMYGLNLSRG
jgi:hypothetical protein